MCSVMSYSETLALYSFHHASISCCVSSFDQCVCIHEAAIDIFGDLFIRQ